MKYCLNSQVLFSKSVQTDQNILSLHYCVQCIPDCLLRQIRQKKIVYALWPLKDISILFDIFAAIYNLIGVPEQFDLKSINSKVFHKRLLSQGA